jgi:hypothetical protein
VAEKKEEPKPAAAPKAEPKKEEPKKDEPGQAENGIAELRNKAKAAMAEIVKLGTTATDIKTYGRAFHGEGVTPAPDAVVDSLVKLKAHLQGGGKGVVDEFNFDPGLVGFKLSGRSVPADVGKVDAPEDGAAVRKGLGIPETEDPAIIAARVELTSTLGWKNGHRTEIAAYYMADYHVSANSVKEFLEEYFGAPLTDNSIGKQEGFLSISRHIPAEGSPELAEYVKKTRGSYSAIESGLSNRLGKPIRYAALDGFEDGAVYAKLKEIMAAAA